MKGLSILPRTNAGLAIEQTARELSAHSRDGKRLGIGGILAVVMVMTVCAGLGALSPVEASVFLQYSFDGPSGALTPDGFVFNDQSGQNNHGTVVYAPFGPTSAAPQIVSSPAAFGQSWQDDNQDEQNRIEFTTPFSPGGAQAWTIAFWHDMFGGVSRPLFASGAGADSFFVRADSVTKIFLSLDGQATLSWDTAGIITQSSFAHYAIVADPDGIAGVDVDGVLGNDTIALYVNGNLLTPEANQDITNYATNVFADNFGDHNSSSGGSTFGNGHGVTDELWIFEGEALSQVQIANLIDFNSIEDSDNDSVVDAIDNCVTTPNPAQEDMDADGRGDICDVDTISTNVVQNDGSFYAQTPFYSLRRDAAGEILFAERSGYAANASFAQAVPTDGIVIDPQEVDVGGVTWTKTPDSGYTQSTWNSVVGETEWSCTGGGCAGQPANMRGHFSTGANSIAYGVEIEPVSTQAGSEYRHTVRLDLSGCGGTSCNLDTSELGGTPPVSGQGRISIFKATDVMRISAPQCGASGTTNVLEDDGVNFIGIEELTKELSDTSQICPGGAECGANVSDGEREVLMKTTYTSRENFGDQVIGTWSVTQGATADEYFLTAICPASFVDLHRATTDRFAIGFAVSSLTNADFGSGNTVYVNRSAAFDEEAFVSGQNTTFMVENAPMGTGGYRTFDGDATDYSLLPNDGGACAEEKCADEATQAGVTFSGSDVAFAGTTTYVCPEGCGGLAVEAGSRAPATHPRIASEPSRYVANKAIRPRFSAENLVVTDASFALSAQDVDIDLETLTFQQAEDPALVNISAKQSGYFGVRASGENAPVIDYNMSETVGSKIVSGPVDLGSCTEATVGNGTCNPTIQYDPPSMGQASLRIRKLAMTGLADPDNPNNSIQPPGDGVSCEGLQACEIGNEEFDQGSQAFQQKAGPLFGPSKIAGFETGVSVVGPANVTKEETHPAELPGVPLSFDAALNPGGLDPVPAMPVVVQNARITRVTTGVAIGANVIAKVSDSNIDNTENTAISFGNAAANEATEADVVAAGGECDLHPNGIACLTAENLTTAPNAAISSADYRANIAEGKSAIQRVEISNNWICVDPDTLQPSCGQNIVIPVSTVEDTDRTLEQTSSNLTVLRRPMTLTSVPITISEGPDTVKHPQLVAYAIQNNNIAVRSPGIAKDNFEAVVPPLANETVSGNCFLTELGTCVTSTSTQDEREVIATVKADPGTATESEAAVDTAGSEPLPVGTRDETGAPVDECPADPAKTVPGVCGCGTADTDRDGDGTADCNDLCSADPAKTVPGQCGCGIADSDADGDSIADCVDNCPAIANADQTDTDEDGEGNACDTTPHHDSCTCGSSGNHGKYVRCVVEALKTEGNQSRGDIKSLAAQSSCKL